MQVEIRSENYQLEDKNICRADVAAMKLEQSIHSIIEKEGFIKYKIDKNCISTNGGNYLGVLYEIDIKGKTKDGDKELNIFVKNIISGENEMKIICVPNAYKTELFAYKELSKLFNELQDEANVPSEKRYKMVKSYEESSTEAIIMENAVKKGFNTGHRMDVISLKFAKLAIEELAKFHALSFVIKEKFPQYFESHIKTMESPFNTTCEDWQGFTKSMIKIVLDNIDENLKERVENICVDIGDRYGRSFLNNTIKHCLCHGDYRPNNILSKMTDGEVSEVIPVDYQLLYYGCPIFDFFYFIFTSTDREFRRAHLSNLKELYYSTLTRFLKYFDVDVDSVYPRKKFDKEYEENKEHGLMVSFFFLPFFFVLDNDVPDLSTDQMSSISFQVDEKFKDRIRGIVQDYTDWGLI